MIKVTDFPDGCANDTHSDHVHPTEEALRKGHLAIAQALKDFRQSGDGFTIVDLFKNFGGDESSLAGYDNEQPSDRLGSIRAMIKMAEDAGNAVVVRQDILDSLNDGREG